ncbi:MAG: hypothetical protein CVU77_02840 [Elusimicrobia bacterium HGW-Elusimicrobia-1]|jgi:hypothetical protein|nr:MAG: hypothetical protein CVU77_02840 [Elusimicrobia bacterium HGW-Elusimicrobia-1]
MKTRMGLWIDHRKAVIVAVTDKGEDTILILSKVEKHLQRSGDSSRKGYASRQAPASDSRQRMFTGHINVYYDAIIACLRAAESILIFGPGEAKGELKKRLIKSKLGGRIAGVEAVGNMTDNQIVAKVRRRFAK